MKFLFKFEPLEVAVLIPTIIIGIIFFITFLVLIFIGSLANGWHYAIDGYVGAILVLLCWHFTDIYIIFHRKNSANTTR